jgi:uncharacterized membrane protein
MSKGIKRTIIVILILVILAGVWIGGRYIYLKQRYAPFCAAVNEESLLSLRGNLYVSAMRHITKNEVFGIFELPN